MRDNHKSTDNPDILDLEMPGPETNNPSSTATSHYDEERVDYFQHQFLKVYLHRVFTDRTQYPFFKVVRLLGRDLETPSKPRPLTLHDNGSGSNFVSDSSVEATVFHDGLPYEVMVHTIKNGYRESLYYFISVLGLCGESNKPRSLIRFLQKESLEHSSYKNQFLSVKASDDRSGVSFDISVLNLEHTRPQDIFLASPVEESLRFFVECVKNYSTVRQPMRYLLSGKPGTAKTKTIRGIANEVKGKATFIFTDGSEEHLDEVFELAECFDPVVLCIDDVDLIVGNRDFEHHRAVLAKFLQRMDGFVGSGVFVLATTNDKMMVDMAASRPGRFDMILDMNPIDSKYYLDLIKTKTNSEKIVSLFDDSVLQLLDGRKVTGAFITALVKHLQVADEIRFRQIGKEYVVDMIGRMDAGFNKRPKLGKGAAGFEILGE